MASSVGVVVGEDVPIGGNDLRSFLRDDGVPEALPCPDPVDEALFLPFESAVGDACGATNRNAAPYPMSQQG